jgi:hypothetical protein
LDKFAPLLAHPSGHALYFPEVFTEMGFPADFILPLNRAHRPDVIFDPVSETQSEVQSVFELDFWWALAKHVGADTREAATKAGRGTQARELRDAILVRLEGIAAEATS